MTKNEIIRMARKAGFVIWSDTAKKGMIDWACKYDIELEHFAALVAARKGDIAMAEAYRCGYEAGQLAEREACAVAAEQVVPRHTECGNKIAASIRARGDK